jgi:hypothetical protein
VWEVFEFDQFRAKTTKVAKSKSKASKRAHHALPDRLIVVGKLQSKSS